MIVARIIGGLGNQMFQYAFGRFLADRHGTEFYLDISGFDRYPLRSFQLNQFQLSAKLLPDADRKRLPGKFQNPRPNCFTSIRQWPWRLRSVREKTFGYRSWWLKVPDNSYLRGYWQSEKAFPGLRSILLNEFQLRHRPHPQTSRMAEQMMLKSSLAVHVRRGDYANDPVVRKTHKLLDLDYYHWCIDDYLSRKESAHLYIFSDDLAWCRKNLALRCPVTWVEHTSADTACEDMFLMTKASGNVIANSTFSWWGAWLNDRPGKRVYTPQNWFQPNTLDSTGLICDQWIAVDSANRNPSIGLRQAA